MDKVLVAHSKETPFEYNVVIEEISFQIMKM
jgi:hypothetical protein